MIKAGAEELEKSVESCERWEWLGGLLVVFGVTAAVAIAAIHPQYDSFLEQWGSAVADGLVAIGVVVEIKFGRMAGLRQNELRRRSDESAAQANRRAEEAKLQLAMFQRKVGTRVILREPFLRSLEQQPKPRSGEILYSKAAADGWYVASELARLLDDAGWPRFSISALDSNDPIFDTSGGWISPAFPLAAIGIDGPDGENFLEMPNPQRALMVALGDALGSTTGKMDKAIPAGALRVVIFPRA